MSKDLRRVLAFLHQLIENSLREPLSPATHQWWLLRQEFRCLLHVCWATGLATTRSAVSQTAYVQQKRGQLAASLRDAFHMIATCEAFGSLDPESIQEKNVDLHPGNLK